MHDELLQFESALTTDWLDARLVSKDDLLEMNAQIEELEAEVDGLQERVEDLEYQLEVYDR